MSRRFRRRADLGPAAPAPPARKLARRRGETARRKLLRRGPPCLPVPARGRAPCPPRLTLHPAYGPAWRTMVATQQDFSAPTPAQLWEILESDPASVRFQADALA